MIKIISIFITDIIIYKHSRRQVVEEESEYCAQHAEGMVSFLGDNDNDYVDDIDDVDDVDDHDHDDAYI